MNTFFWSIGATILVSIISLVGVVALSIKEKILEKILFWSVGLSAGALMGDVFFHLIPEMVEKNFKESVFIYVVLGFCLFFILEKFLHWHHCHKGTECDVKTFTYMNLVGDGLHNFIDGLIIAGSFAASFELGIATSIAVVIHEIPQEISDFGVLVYGGFSKIKALFYNFLSATLAILGAIIGVIIVFRIENFTNFLLALTAGGFIYIAAADLIPEIHKKNQTKESLASFFFFVLSLVFMYLMRLWFE